MFILIFENIPFLSPWEPYTANLCQILLGLLALA